MPKAKLDELFARGLGVIEEARVEFGLGFNVITGETGAGKTLLLGALDLCLGGDSVAARNAITTEMQAAAIFNVEVGRTPFFIRFSDMNRERRI